MARNNQRSKSTRISLGRLSIYWKPILVKGAFCEA